jgi:hypothetical protein
VVRGLHSGMISQKSEYSQERESRGSVALTPVVGSERQPQQVVALGLVTARAGRASAAALAGVRTLPRSVGMVLANPSAVVASETFAHAPHKLVSTPSKGWAAYSALAIIQEAASRAFSANLRAEQ